MTITHTEQFTVRRSPADNSADDHSLAGLLPPAGHFIGGSFVPGSSTHVIDVVDPTTEQVISAVQASFWHCLELLQIAGARPGYGQLFDGRIAAGA